MTRVDLLSFDLHRPDGVVAYQASLATNITGSAQIMNIWYSPELKTEIVVWNDGL